jgi:hypothetical protein
MFKTLTVENGEVTLHSREGITEAAEAFFEASKCGDLALKGLQIQWGMHELPFTLSPLASDRVIKGLVRRELASPEAPVETKQQLTPVKSAKLLERVGYGQTPVLSQ